jgi:hypothetical protein
VLADGGVWKLRSLVTEQQQLVGNEEIPLRPAVQRSYIFHESRQHSRW